MILPSKRRVTGNRIKRAIVKLRNRFMIDQNNNNNNITAEEAGNRGAKTKTNSQKHARIHTQTTHRHTTMDTYRHTIGKERKGRRTTRRYYILSIISNDDVGARQLLDD